MKVGRRASSRDWIGDEFSRAIHSVMPVNACITTSNMWMNVPDLQWLSSVETTDPDIALLDKICLKLH